MSRVKAIIFDWGGVLIENPEKALLGYCSRLLGVSPVDLSNAYHKFEPEFTMGLLSEPQLWKGIGKTLGVAIPNTRSIWGNAIRHVYTPCSEMFDLVERLKQNGYKTALLSNTEMPTVEFFHLQKYCCFDLAIFSCVEGIKKPDRRIYERTVQRLGVVPADAIFIDDRGDYIEGAQVVGLHTILFSSPGATRQLLREFGVKMD